MKKLEILKLARQCLPDIDQDADVTKLCSLWSGMGSIYRVDHRLIVKHVAAPRNVTSFGDIRKQASYQMEANFYENVASSLLSKGVMVPTPLLVKRDAGKKQNEIVIVMSYIQKCSIDVSEPSNMNLVLSWLAKFHASYWGISEETTATLGLQQIGSYWHLETRPDEHQTMPNNGWEGRLKLAAAAIDSRLKRDEFQCIIHGDAKDANILCESDSVFFCDFQYCGRGVPAKDLVYFFCSSACPDNETDALKFYLGELKANLPASAKVPMLDEVQAMMDLAYCDYFRFMSGWGFWGSGGGEERVIQVLNELDGGSKLESEAAYDAAVRRTFR